MWLDCPRAVIEPPTCTGKDQCGSLRFDVSVEYDVNALNIDCTERTCECDLNTEEWNRLEDEAVDHHNEGPSEP